MELIFHPGDYDVILANDRRLWWAAGEHGQYYRLPKEEATPEGYSRVLRLWSTGKPVHEGSGLLNERFWGLPRYRV